MIRFKIKEKFVQFLSRVMAVRKCCQLKLSTRYMNRLRILLADGADEQTCDTFLNPNQENWNFWSGNLCLVSGGFMLQISDFFTEVKVREI